MGRLNNYFRKFVHGSWAGRRVLRPGVTSLALLAIAGITVSCGDEPNIRFGRGRAIEVHVTNPVIAERVAFVDKDGRHRVLRSRASNRQLALVEVTIVNRTSVVTPLLIDPEAAQLGNRRGERVNAIDAFETAAVVDSGGADEIAYAPLLWGQIDLERRFQVGGWMAFDVPKGLTLGTLWWTEVETVLVDFIDYNR